MPSQRIENKLFYGDCLAVMQDMPLGSVDLIYLDPPFNSKRAYNAIYKDETGKQLPNQIEAFCDTWQLDEERERALEVMPRLMLDDGIDYDIVRFWELWIKALRNTQPGLLAYLSYMTERLLFMKKLLKPTGSIYLHCDPTASHYIKVMMDSIFGHKNFRNEIVWAYTGPSSVRKQYPRKHDTILFYSNGEEWVFNADDIRVPYKRLNTQKSGGGIGGDMDEHRVESYKKRGKIPESWWSDISPVGRIKSERTGYATQKPLALLERIIKASSNAGDVIFDPFCGCATTIEAAHKLGRKWIGVDIAIHAIKRVSNARLRDRLGLVEGRDFII